MNIKLYQDVLNNLKENELSSYLYPNEKEIESLLIELPEVPNTMGVLAVSFDEPFENYFLAECNSALEIGLISLKKSQAKILSQNKSALVLGKLNKISDLAAKELSFYQGNILELPALNQLSPKAFAYLNEFKGDFLTIGSLKKNHFKP